MWYKLFLFLIAILPFSFALNPASTVDLPIVRLLIPLVLVFWLFGGLLTKKLQLDIRPRFFLFAIFIFISFVSFFWALNPSLSLRKALFLVSVAPLYFVAFAATFEKTRREQILRVLVWSGFFAALFALVQFSLQFFVGLDPALEIIRWYVPFFLGISFSELVFSFPSWMVNISGKTVLRTFGSFPDPHIFSVYINMLLPVAFYLFFSTRQRLFLVFAISMLLASLLSFSRASYLSLAAAALFFMFSPWGFSFLKKHFALYFFIALGITLLAITPNPLTTRLLSSLDINEGSNSGRIEMWNVAMEGIRQNPWRGVGIGNFPFLVDPQTSMRNPVYAHNILLDFGAETGIANTLVLLATILAPIFFYFRKKTLLALAIATSFVVFLIHSMFETPFFSIHVFPLFCILLALKTDD